MLKALCVRQPWAWLIINAGKDFENNLRYTDIRGPVLIYAAQEMTLCDYAHAVKFMDSRGINIMLPEFDALERRGIIGNVEIIGCVRFSKSPWFFGPVGWELRNPTPLPFIPLEGMNGFFDVPHCLIGENHV